MTNLVCPWKFLGGDEPKQPSLDASKLEKNAPKKSYAEMAKEARFQQFDLQTLPVPEKMGDYMAVTIPTKDYERGLDYCKYALIGRIDYRVWTAGGSCNFDEIPLRLSPWTTNFIPETQKQSHALVWIKLPGLGQEFWDPETLMSIARGVDQIYVKAAEALEFWQDIEVAKLPRMCNHCKIVGHLAAECKKLRGVL
ncbi:hypothetical protein FRX31_004056 [Thalictrum thalictroides]|uniref:Uncharacterized protein n=1 Tax=Thalictrum thalictroides TaxID=46969 RepID=A0A7J6XBL7_THATH|nr:hypothetical protein FRX31_004056 [Thalictrum thalictroides]